jgi:hypothetical protein
VFTCIGALSIAKSLDLLQPDDIDLLGWWLSERQCDSGGLNGRPEKQADVVCFLQASVHGPAFNFVQALICYLYLLFSSVLFLVDPFCARYPGTTALDKWGRIGDIHCSMSRRRRRRDCRPTR